MLSFYGLARLQINSRAFHTLSKMESQGLDLPSRRNTWETIISDTEHQISQDWFLREETNEMSPVMASVYSFQRGCRLRSRKGGTEKPHVAMEKRCVEFTGQSLLWGLQRAAPAPWVPPEDWSVHTSKGKEPCRSERNPVFPQHWEWLFPQPSRWSPQDVEHCWQRSNPGTWPYLNRRTLCSGWSFHLSSQGCHSAEERVLLGVPRDSRVLNLPSADSVWLPSSPSSWSSLLLPSW